MMEDSVPSIVASVYGWFTPAVFFVIVNIVIGGIAVASKSSHHQPGADDGGAYPGRFLARSISRSLSRSPSIVVDRLRSFNLQRYYSGDISLTVDTYASSATASGTVDDGGVNSGPSLARSVSRSPSIVLDRLRSFNFHHYFSPEIHPFVDVAPAPETEIMKEAPLPEPETEDEHGHQNLGRSQSDAHPTAGEMPPKLAVRMKKSASEKSAFAHFQEAEIKEAIVDPVQEDEGDEVDARADDFINRFRQQLKLQRLESLLRYKEMLNRGT
ncbi:hypothetical protein Cni_G16925 [Canna indica]|uniref:DUF4408 domain-containing protein n=1 Tax=Canna indica TaxID=4628 RepID=A0AAQ3QGA5_9LILI|nr:hypothetical protein Cni_G16925 [Canna indica]